MSVQQALNRSTESITASLRAVAPLNNTAEATLPPTLPGLAESLGQLLKQLHYQVTSVSLSFKPPITPAAAVATLDKLTDTFGRVAACVVAVTGGKDGGALVSEWKEGVESVGAEILRLFDVFGVAAERDARGEGASKTSNEENPYLIHTGLVWEAIDRLSKDLSGSEVDAVGKRWRGQGEVMKDAWSEFKEFLEEQDDEDDEAGADEDEEEGGFELDEDDEFAELEGMMKGGKMTPQERARAEAAKSLFGLHQILQATIPRYLPLLVLDPEESYRPLLEVSSALTAAFDSAVTAMYPSQEKDEIETAVKDLGQRSVALAQSIKSRLDRAKVDEAKAEACQSFLTKWEERLKKEEETWAEKGLSVAALGHALP